MASRWQHCVRFDRTKISTSDLPNRRQTHCALLYGLNICGSTYPSDLTKLASLQNRAIKLVAGGKYRDYANPFYSQLKVLELSDLVKHETAKIVRCKFHFHLHPQLPPLFIKFSHLPTRTTRAVNSSCQLVIGIIKSKTQIFTCNIELEGNF